MTTEKLSTKFFKAVEGVKSLYEIRIEDKGISKENTKNAKIRNRKSRKNYERIF